VQIGAADCAGAHPDQHLRGAAISPAARGCPIAVRSCARIASIPQILTRDERIVLNRLQPHGRHSRASGNPGAARITTVAPGPPLARG
jgi:hypothetical protein